MYLLMYYYYVFAQLYILRTLTMVVYYYLVSHVISIVRYKN